MPDPKLIALASPKRPDPLAIRATLESAEAQSGSFSAVIVCALLENEDQEHMVRVFASSLTRLERIGLLSEALKALLDD